MVSASFASSPREIRAARRFAMEAAAGWGCNLEDLTLVVSELATNACVHAKTPFTLSVCRTGSRMVVEVADENPAPPEVLQSSTGPSGRGMKIVDTIAGDWGFDQGETGKSVWAVLDCT
jgi:anti-sigma regulatory factor (Ser/Thr protein kinase)